MTNFPLKPLAVLVTVASIALITSCTTTQTPEIQQKPVVKENKPQPPVMPPVVVPPPPIVQPSQPVVQKPTTIQYSSFSAWKNDFNQRAVNRGFHADDVSRLLSMAEYNAQVISLDKGQPEFAKMPWEYVDSAVSSGRVSGGKKQYTNNYTLLNQIEHRYGVPASIVTAIWGMESSYGQGTGNSSLPSALGTLAYEGRRQAFAEEQLFAMLQLIQRGDVSWSQLRGSWAGGMGHTQFIPATWLNEGVDGNMDGHKNPWNMTDALHSTASYLANSGWQAGVDAFYEVRLPNNFDYRTLNSKKSVSEWQSLGVQGLTGLPSGHVVAELMLPAGKQGPALLLTKNFEAIRVYNNSFSYALGVSLLAKSIIGQSGLQQSWPRYEQPLANYQIRQLQEKLTLLGYDTKGIDGVAGHNTRLAFARWQADNGHVPDGFISQNSARQLVH